MNILSSERISQKFNYKKLISFFYKMQELIIQNPELYSMVVGYVGNQLPKLLLLCKASYQIIMRHELYNLQITTHEINLDICSVTYGLNLRNQLHGVCVITFDFDSIIDITYHENQLVEIKYDKESTPILSLRERIFKTMGESAEYDAGSIIHTNYTIIKFHDNGIIRSYDDCAERVIFRDDFTIKKFKGGIYNLVYYGNNNIRCEKPNSDWYDDAQNIYYNLDGTLREN